MRAADGAATWTLQPASSCPASDPTDEWRFSYRWTTRKYVIRTKPRTGVRSVGGFRINAKATVKAARRKFGRPSRVHRPSRQVCTLTWRKIGLRMAFVNWGGAHACSHGYAQSALVFRPKLWAVQVGTRFVPGGAFEVEVGVPVNGDGGRTEDAYVAELPAGRYAVHVHEGAYSADDETWAGRDLASAHQRMETWAAEQGLRWATDDDGRFVGMVEQYLVGPAESFDVADWRTSIAKLVED